MRASTAASAATLFLNRPVTNFAFVIKPTFLAKIRATNVPGGKLAVSPAVGLFSFQLLEGLRAGTKHTTAGLFCFHTPTACFRHTRRVMRTWDRTGVLGLSGYPSNCFVLASRLR